MGIDDLAVLDPELVQPRSPRLELGPVRDMKGELVEPGPELAEPIAFFSSGMTMEAHHSAAREDEDDVVERSCVLVEGRFHLEEPPVPLRAGLEIRHSQG